MIANFFQSLEDSAVDYLLISGQATVLYGAATFSEDIDLWVHPTQEHLDRFVTALRACHARYYKLTPPLTIENLQRGHGFHFVLPMAREDDVFLDVMGAPPRVGRFDASRQTAQWQETDWGRLHTIGIKDLVELKKTQRLEDYPIIGKLALAYFDQPECSATPSEFQWALQNIFTLQELRTFLAEHPAAADAPLPDSPHSVLEFVTECRSGGDPDESVAQRVNEWMQDRIGRLQHADRQYWRGIIADLKGFRSAGTLMTEGSVV
jgi:hypothetical protein